MHHLVGLKNTEFTVAVNSDPEAAIFCHCDQGLVGDFREIVPALIKAIKTFSGKE
jgi:electron transfer flavoprotein alpha subunit